MKKLLSAVMLCCAVSCCGGAKASANFNQDLLEIVNKVPHTLAETLAPSTFGWLKDVNTRTELKDQSTADGEAYFIIQYDHQDVDVETINNVPQVTSSLVSSEFKVNFENLATANQYKNNTDALWASLKHMIAIPTNTLFIKLISLPEDRRVLRIFNKKDNQEMKELFSTEISNVETAQ